ncbi:hypothetical protein A3Q56_05694 [Intoshia linei]|uniref:WD repeat-containing protein 63 n=1 Tax=Intoshia linei TaxID=1819745 RepID=A0A177AYX4_9BILA|nr:hypothetical protein A3Q56_05694 [Intoshia linei]
MKELIFEEDETQKIITIKEYVSSNVEASHYLAVTDLQWVPAYFEILRTGLPQSTNSSKCQQLITSSLDGNIFVWNLRSPKKYTSETEENADIYANIKDLNLVWVPILKVDYNESSNIMYIKITCRKCDTNEYLAPTRFSIGPHNSSCEKTFSNLENENEMATLQSKTILLDVNTLIQGGSEDGYIFSIDWIPEKDQETGKPITAKPDFSSSIHDGYVNFCTRSSFFNDIILCVGGWTWSLWKAGTNSGPILKCCAYQYYLKSGCWSQTRPSLFYIARSDGNLEIWDILDRTHEPFSVQNVCSADICYITTKNTSENEEFIALGDSTGTLHIRQIPSSFFKQKQNEFEKTRTYFENEVERRNFVQHRWDLREKEKIEHEIELKRNAGIGANVHLNEDDILANMKVEYNKYLDLELEILRELGLKDDDSILEKDNEEIGKIVQVST